MESDRIDHINLYKTGLLRLKPGRGPFTHSHSCSDKILVWNHIGIEGTVLSVFYNPIYIKAYVINSRFDEEAMKRGCFLRVQYRETSPLFVETKLDFKYKKSLERIKSSNVCINYIINCGTEYTVGSAGKKYGSNKTDFSDKCLSRLCPYLLFKGLKYLELKESELSNCKTKQNLLNKLKFWNRKPPNYYTF